MYRVPPRLAQGHVLFSLYVSNATPAAEARKDKHRDRFTVNYEFATKLCLFEITGSTTSTLANNTRLARNAQCKNLLRSTYVTAVCSIHVSIIFHYLCTR